MRIEQEATYAGDDRWRWAVWIEAPEFELNRIESVEYTLHPTFPQPVQRVWDRRNRFRLEASGWGEFEINAHAFMDDGDPRHLRHWLNLVRPDSDRHDKEPRDRESPTVLVSVAAADAPWGDAIQQALFERGFNAVTTDDALEPGKPWEASIASAIDNADLVIGVFSDSPSLWVEREVREAAAHDVAVVPIAVGGKPEVPEWLAGRSVSVSRSVELGPVIDSLAKNYPE